MKTQKLSLIIGIVLLAYSGAFAQSSVTASAPATASDERDINRQFIDLRNRSSQIRRETAYRKTTEIIVEDKTAKMVDHTVVAEFVPPDRNRHLMSTTVKGKVESFETISIGDRIFSRENGGKWKVIRSEYGDPVSGVGSSRTRFIEKTTLDNRIVLVFEETDSFSSRIAGLDSSSVTKYWFTEDGYLLKTIAKKKASGDRPATVETTTFDYSANIVIEEPVITKAVK